MSATIDQQRQRVEQEVTKLVDDLDKSTLRSMQASENVTITLLKSKAITCVNIITACNVYIT